ncbi:MAG TPA: glycoside hydrolase family 38 C-terminal domain-containing protein, partial [Gemmatimonadales bacterium]|nr:glycoside hydrolase family 38 C-terminal domain-containing protein [Gemmatimonadales bacterium]
GTLEITDRRTGERYAGLGALIDEPDRGDLYTYSRGPGAAVRGGKAGKPAVLAQGPLVAALESSWTMRSAGAGWIGVRLVVVLQADSPVVQLRFDLEHQAADHRLRAHFPVGAGTSAVAGTAFGAAVREPVNGDAPRGSIEHPSRTAPAHGFVAAAEGRRGLAILSTGCFEYEWTRNRALAVTLIRAVGRLSRNDLPERPGHAAWPEAVPDAQEPGRHVIELGLVPVTGADVARPGVHPWMRLRPRVQTLFLRGDS